MKTHVNENRFWQPSLEKFVEFSLLLSDFGLLWRDNHVFLHCAVIKTVQKLKFQFGKLLKIGFQRVQIERKLKLRVRENRHVDLSVTGEHETIGAVDIESRHEVENRRVRIFKRNFVGEELADENAVINCTVNVEQRLFDICGGGKIG